MQLEHILATHGLIGRGGKGEAPLPEVVNFIAASKNDGTGVNLSWQNSSVIEYVKTEIFVSTSNIQNSDYDYCVANATKIVDGTVSTFTYNSVIRGATYYFKAFMVFNTLGEIKPSKGIGLSCLIVDTVPPNTITNFQATDGDDSIVNLSWTNPTDADFNKVKIMYKQGSYPTSVTDGSVGYEGSGTSKVVTGLTNGVTYYFRVFTYDNSGNINTSIKNQQISVTPSKTKIYGVEIDEYNSNPKTAVIYTGIPEGYTPCIMSGGTFNYGSWKDFIDDIAVPVVVKNGVVQYELNRNDYTKKSNGTNSIITGADGDVLVRFKHLYVKEEKVGSKKKIWISTKMFDGAKSLTKMTEVGYNQLSQGILRTLQHLFLLLFKDRNSQTALGRGYVDGDSNYINTGGANSKGFFFGETTGKQQMKFLGIEDFWGNKFQWVDGLVSDANRDLLIGYSSFNDAGTGYTKQTTNISYNKGGYFKETQGGEGGYVLADTAGSETTGYTDYGTLSASCVVDFGGNRSSGSNAGAFFVRLDNAASSARANRSARLCFVDEDYFYVGAYLGFVEGSKLRSISGKEPTGSVTIGNFRAHAKNNN